MHIARLGIVNSLSGFKGCGVLKSFLARVVRSYDFLPPNRVQDVFPRVHRVIRDGLESVRIVTLGSENVPLFRLIGIVHYGGSTAKNDQPLSR